MADKLARALEVFSRANAANERRLRREIDPITEPVKPVEKGLVTEDEAAAEEVVLVVVVAEWEWAGTAAGAEF